VFPLQTQQHCAGQVVGAAEECAAQEVHGHGILLAGVHAEAQGAEEALVVILLRGLLRRLLLLLLLSFH